jgi:starch phosphorylase
MKKNRIERVESRSPFGTPAGMALESARTGRTAECIARSVRDHLKYSQGRHAERATRHDWYMALSYAVRDRVLGGWVETVDRFLHSDARVVCYLSAEFLVGPHLANNLVNLGLYEEAGAACEALGLGLEELCAAEEEPGLGNGGLGRLAACFLESLATLEVPAIGYGIRYEFGIFDQEIHDGRQIEITDRWLRWGNPWEIARPEVAYDVPLGGHTEPWVDDQGRFRVRWVPERVVKGIAHDTPVVGYRVGTTDLMRLWKAEASESFDFQSFNVGDYWGAVEDKVVSENLSKVLYPNDEPPEGKRLRLEQQFFFVSCSLQDMIQAQLASGNPLEKFHETFAVQLNDTHPAVGVPELMRLLIDVHEMEWDEAWDVTTRSFSYTNHTLLPEALETWSLPLFGSVLPRHLEIIYEINRRFLGRVMEAFPDDDARVQRMSLIDERGERRVRMANLATVGSHAVNGVAELHTKLLKRTVLADFHELDPKKIHNITNGVTPRRWMLLSNPCLSRLITSRIGERWVTHPEEELPELESAVRDAAFLDSWRRVQRASKESLAMYISRCTGINVDPGSMFDVLVKRIHEYKRQHLDVLHVISRYHRMLQEPSRNWVPRTVIFAGKAAPGYFLAKQIIELIHAVGRRVNSDPKIAGRLKVVFIPDFNVSVSQRIYPAADLSEQISLAGKEASGTGNMKFAMNGALTIGTLDGANVEIREAVGTENFFLFGMNVDQVRELRSSGYEPRSIYLQDPDLREAIDAISSGEFSEGDDRFRALVASLLDRDEYFVLADFRDYVECQSRVDEAYRDARGWDRMSVLNTARSGRFSSDRSIREYCDRIWNVREAAVRAAT